MNFEDDLRTLLREHDFEAPTGLDLAAPPAARRRRFVLPALAAAAVIVVVAAVAAGFGPARLRPDTGPVGVAPPACPARFEKSDSPAGWVPARDTLRGGDARLVPDVEPTAAVACGYVDGKRTVRRLTDLASIRSTLTLAPRIAAPSICFQYRTQYDSQNYLLGLRYDGGTLWVSAPRDHCAGSGNGRFASRFNLGRSAAIAVLSGHWPGTLRTDPSPVSGTADACAVPNAGRLGDDKRLVPLGVTGIRICDGAGPAGRPNRTRTLTGAEASRVIGLLDRIRPEASSPYCRPSGLTIFPLRLVLRYDEGPSMVISVDPQCGLWADNGALKTSLTKDQILQLRRLLS